jgi:hypothetical protein
MYQTQYYNQDQTTHYISGIDQDIEVLTSATFEHYLIYLN